MTELNILPYRSDQADAIVELMNVALGRTDEVTRDVAYWRWKHELNPFGTSLVLLGELDGRLVGMRSFLRWRLSCGDQMLEAAKPVDTVTHPDYQRRGIFSQLTRAAIEQAREHQVALLFNTPNANSLPGYLKLGWKPIAELPIRMSLCRPMRAALRMARRPATKLEFDRSEFVDASVVTAAEAVQRLEAVWSNTGWKPPEVQQAWRTPRTLEFLRWRYTQHPHQAYFACLDETDGMLTGVAFVRCGYRRSVRELMVCDLLWNQSQGWDGLDRLLRSVRRTCRADWLVGHAAAETETARRMSARGFRVVPGKRITLVGNIIGESVPTPDVMHETHWMLAMGDIEGL